MLTTGVMVCGRRVKAIYVGPAPRTEPLDSLGWGGARGLAGTPPPPQMAQTVTGRANFGGNYSVALNLRATTEPWRQSHRRTAAALTTCLIILTVLRLSGGPGPILLHILSLSLSGYSVAKVVYCICCIHSYIALFPFCYSLWLFYCWICNTILLHSILFSYKVESD